MQSSNNPVKPQTNIAGILLGPLIGFSLGKFINSLGKYPSAIVLTLVNIFPVFAHFVFGFDLKYILILYWSENVIIGFFNVFRMIMCEKEVPFEINGKLIDPIQNKKSGQMAKWFVIPFFIMHYGIFTAVHGFFIIFLSVMIFAFNGPGYNFESGPSTPGPNLDNLILQVGLPALLLFASHFFSFVFNYIGKKEYAHVSLMQLMFQPYSRIVIVHLAVLFGTFIAVFIGFTTGPALLLVGLKTIIDLLYHLKSRTRYEEWQKEVESDASVTF